MTEFWKSQPRKFCEYCKCWIADNKSSRDFHERGKKHQDNVRKKIDELRKKGVKDAKKEEEMSNQMAAMEKAAMAALKKDLTENPAMASQYGLKVKEEETTEKPSSGPSSGGAVADSATASSSTTGAVDMNPEYWHEAVNPDGFVYYWNSFTGESAWEKPKGYISEAERAGHEKGAAAEAVTEITPTMTKTEKKKKPTKPQPASIGPSLPPTGTRDGSTVSARRPEFKGKGSKFKDTRPKVKAPTPQVKPTLTFGPAMKSAPFGQWECIPEQQPEPEAQDLQLPVVETPIEEEVKVVKIDEPKIKFREKKVDTLGAGFVAFKKRKLAGGQRNIKQREDDG